MHVTVIDFSKVFVPNAFTPDNNGLNDVLKITVYGKIIIDGFYIYNRWGQLVFTTTNPRIGWDGKINGILQGSATFVWLAEAIDYKNNLIKRKGTVTLIR